MVEFGRRGVLVRTAPESSTPAEYIPRKPSKPLKASAEKLPRCQLSTPSSIGVKVFHSSRPQLSSLWNSASTKSMISSAIKQSVMMHLTALAGVLTRYGDLDSTNRSKPSRRDLFTC